MLMSLTTTPGDLHTYITHSSLTNLHIKHNNSHLSNFAKPQAQHRDIPEHSSMYTVEETNAQPLD